MNNNFEYNSKKALTSDYEVKISHESVEGYNAQNIRQQLNLQNNDKELVFKKRLKRFNEVQSVKAAKELLQKIMPIKTAKTVFRVGAAKCTIINEKDVLYINFNSNEECICYNFTKPNISEDQKS